MNGNGENRRSWGRLGRAGEERGGEAVDHHDVSMRLIVSPLTQASPFLFFHLTYASKMTG